MITCCQAISHGRHDEREGQLGVELCTEEKRKRLQMKL
jgi:hypothetical protein